jgi:hypothetical protein
MHTPLWSYYFYLSKALRDLFPQHAQLHFRETVAHAAMNAEAE